MSEMMYVNLHDATGASIVVHTKDGSFFAIDQSANAQVSGSAQIVDCQDGLLLPALVEPHVHLDKTLWGGAWRGGSAGPTLKDYIENERRVLRTLTSPIAERSAPLLERCIAQGSLYIRSHIDVDPELGLKHVEAMLALREQYKYFVEMQFVAFPQTGLLIRPGTAELMQEALKLGVETVGGLDPAGIDGDPIGQLRTVFGMAEAHGCGVDIHLHDQGELGVWQIERIAEFTKASGLSGKVMVSHAFCLGMMLEKRIEKLAQKLADLKISLMTSAPADIAIPPVEYLRKFGVNVCCGSDGIRDSWSPLGNGDMLERAFLLAFRFDWNSDKQFEIAMDAATHAGARAIGLTNYGLNVGADANFIVVPATTVGDAICRRPRERLVIRKGRVIASDGKTLCGIR